MKDIPLIDADEITKQLKKTFRKRVDLKNVVFVCIGTDRSTGDSLGPLVGTFLKRMGYTNVIGDIDDPCHAQNIAELVDSIPKDKTVIAIDSCLGRASSIGRYQIHKGPIKPGAGVQKELPPVGEYAITGIVNIGGFMEYLVLQNTRLSLVLKMAEAIANGLASVLPNQTMLEVAAGGEKA